MLRSTRSLWLEDDTMDAPLSPSLDQEPSPPGTLLWIGPTGHREFTQAYRFCRDHAAQLAVRRDLAEAIRRPAGYVRRIVMARPTRQPPRRGLWERFSARYENVPMLALCGSLCDGEARTGTPWPVDCSLRFSRWSERLPQWLIPCGARPQREDPIAALLVISDRFEMAEPYLHWGGACGLLTAWHRRFLPALHGRFDTVLWDDSAAAPAVAATWQARLGAADGGTRPLAETQWQTRQRFRQRHLWLALQPSSEAIAQAHAGGVCRVLTKPARLEAIFSVPQADRLSAVA